jgi:uncharacterized membrane protein YecN with MAPEG domain
MTSWKLSLSSLVLEFRKTSKVAFTSSAKKRNRRIKKKRNTYERKGLIVLIMMGLVQYIEKLLP